MNFIINQIADVGSRITWTDKRYRRFLYEIKDLLDFKGEINNNWGMYALYIHSNGRTIKDFIDTLSQYSISVDSVDRNISAFPDPFQFNIIFNGDKYSNQPVIQKKYKDIKYLKLETLTLPDMYSIKKDVLTLDIDYTTIHTYFDINYNHLSNNDLFTITLSSTTPTIRIVSICIDGTNWIINYILNDNPTYVYEMNQDVIYNKYYINTSKKISNDRIFYVYIPEITSYNYTSNQEDVTFFVTATGTNDYTLLNNVYPTFLFYRDSILQNALKYTVKIRDRFGNDYKVNNLDKNANLSECNCESDNINYSCRCSYIRNPYYIKLQVNLQFKFGIFEDDLYKDYLNVHPKQ
jgi:hypothetical protein